MSADVSERFSSIQKEIYRHGHDRGKADTIADLRNLIVKSLDSRALKVFDECVDILKGKEDDLR